MTLKNVICKNCKTEKLELKILVEPKEIEIACCNCGLTQTLIEYTKDCTFSDLKEK